jgi:hypothetical protein
MTARPFGAQPRPQFSCSDHRRRHDPRGRISSPRATGSVPPIDSISTRRSSPRSSTPGRSLEVPIDPARPGRSPDRGNTAHRQSAAASGITPSARRRASTHRLRCDAAGETRREGLDWIEARSRRSSRSSPRTGRGGRARGRAGLRRSTPSRTCTSRSCSGSGSSTDAAGPHRDRPGGAPSALGYRPAAASVDPDAELWDAPAETDEA